MKQMNVPNKLERAKDSDFTSMEPKAVNTMMKSIKRKPMRDWKEALREYLNEYII